MPPPFGVCPFLPASSVPTTMPPRSRKRKLCLRMLNTGRCNLGDDCAHSHDLTAAVSTLKFLWLAYDSAALAKTHCVIINLQDTRSGTRVQCGARPTATTRSTQQRGAFYLQRHSPNCQFAKRVGASAQCAFAGANPSQDERPFLSRSIGTRPRQRPDSAAFAP